MKSPDAAPLTKAIYHTIFGKYAYLHVVSVGEVQYVSLPLLPFRRSLSWSLQQRPADRFQLSVALGNQEPLTWHLRGYVTIFPRPFHFVRHVQVSGPFVLEITKANEVEAVSIGLQGRSVGPIKNQKGKRLVLPQIASKTGP